MTQNIFSILICMGYQKTQKFLNGAEKSYQQKSNEKRAKSEKVKFCKIFIIFCP